MTKITVPKASYIQHGLQNIIKIIKETECTEGDFLELADQPTNFKFLELFWFFDPHPKQPGEENKLDLVTFSLNLNYGNIRLNGYLNAASALHKQALFLTKDLLTVNAAIYPTGAYHARHLKNGETYHPIEQLFVPYDPEKESWHDELPISFFTKHNDMLKLGIEKSGTEYYYIFKERQYDLFNYALDFICNNGLTIIGIKK